MATTAAPPVSQPVAPPAAPPVSAVSRSVARGEVLYAKALKQQANLQAKRQEEDPNLTFHPKVNKSRKFKEVTPRYLAPRKPVPSRDDSELTFKPKLIARKKRGRGGDTRRRSAPGGVFQSLYRRGVKLAAKQEEERQAAIKSELETLTFTPAVNTKRSPSKRQPLYQASALVDRAAFREALKAKSELAACTFKPTVHAAPARVAGDKEATPGDATSPSAKRAPVFEKLYAEYKAAVARQAAAAAAAEAAQLRECTFRPSVSSSAAAVTRDGEIFERLYKEAAEARKARSARANSPTKCSFKPTIHSLPGGAKLKRDTSKPLHDRLYELGKETLKKRLSVESSDERPAWEEMLRGEAATHTSPTASASASASATAAVTSVSPVHERLYNSAMEQLHARKEAEQADELMHQASVWPTQLRGTSKSVVSPRNLWRKKKKGKVTQQRKKATTEAAAEARAEASE